MSEHIAYLQISVLYYTLNNNKVEMIFDAYNENGRVILSVQRLVWRTLCEWTHIKGFREKIVRIIDEEAIATLVASSYSQACGVRQGRGAGGREVKQPNTSG